MFIFYFTCEFTQKQSKINYETKEKKWHVLCSSPNVICQVNISITYQFLFNHQIWSRCPINVKPILHNKWAFRTNDKCWYSITNSIFIYKFIHLPLHFKSKQQHFFLSSTSSNDLPFYQTSNSSCCSSKTCIQLVFHSLHDVCALCIRSFSRFGSMLSDFIMQFHWPMAIIK